MSAIHYGPWAVTVTDGDTAMHHEVYASTEAEAIEEVMAHSDYRTDPEDGRDVQVYARRV